MTRPALVVSTLIGEAQVELALECLGSLARFSREPVAFQVHDDGTLSGRSLARLREEIPLHAVVDRREADAWAAAALQAKPACLRFRNSGAFGLKLFDVAHFHPGESIAYCDGDVLFLRPFEGLFHLGDPPADFVFMRDSQEAYAIRPWRLAGRRRLELVSRLNSGMFLLNRAALDDAVFERVISGSDARSERLPGWLEQACWAALARSGDARFWLARELLVPSSPGDLSQRPVGVHLTSSVRELLPAARALRDAGALPAHPGTEPAPPLSMAGFCASEARRVFRNRLLGRP
jgi:hypothetical protein